MIPAPPLLLFLFFLPLLPLLFAAGFPAAAASRRVQAPKRVAPAVAEHCTEARPPLVHEQVQEGGGGAAGQVAKQEVALADLLHLLSRPLRIVRLSGRFVVRAARSCSSGQ